jgi:hypothetical protein
MTLLIFSRLVSAYCLGIFEMFDTAGKFAKAHQFAYRPE